MQSRQVYFHDPRPPHHVQFEIERRLMMLLEPVAGEPLLTLQGARKMGRDTYTIRLRFEADLPSGSYAYSLRMETPSDDKSAQGWFDFWARDYQPVAPSGGPGPRYAEIAEQVLRAEAHLDTVPAIQEAILSALRRGATTAHKEGGSVIRLQSGLFLRADYGESSGTERFLTEQSFWKFLREFYHWTLAEHCRPKPVPDLVAWKLLLRLLEPARPSVAQNAGAYLRELFRRL